MSPTRTCIGCREASDTTDLLRIAKSPATGQVDIDPAGSAPGRGAYVHRTSSCWEAAMSEDVLARAFRAGLGPDEVGRLRDRMKTGER